MLRTYLAAYTTPLTDKTGYRWVWRHQKIPDQLLGAFYSKIKKPTDVARWSANELHGGLASVDSEWCAAYRFLDAGRDALGRQGRVFLIAGFLRLNELPQFDLRQVLESPAFSMPLDLPPQRLELDLPAASLRCSKEVLTKLKNNSHIEVVGVDNIGQLVAACATLAGEMSFDLKVDGAPARLVSNLSIQPLLEPSPMPSPLPPDGPEVGNGVIVTPARDQWMWTIGGLIVGLLIGAAIGYKVGHRGSRGIPVEQYPYETPQLNGSSSDAPNSTPPEGDNHPTAAPSRANTLPKAFPNDKR